MNKERVIQRINRMEKSGTALAFLLFSILFAAAQILHPNIFHIEKITEGEAWISHFRHQHLLHWAHMFEFLCAPLLCVMALHLRNELKEKAPVLSFIGVIMAFIGAMMLFGNKSALCLTISGFDTLSDADLASIVPGLDVLLRKDGMLIALALLPLLPLGWILISIALVRTRLIPYWQSIPILIGSTLLANPEIEVINFFASFFLAAGLIPYSLGLFKKSAI